MMLKKANKVQSLSSDNNAARPIDAARVVFGTPSRRSSKGSLSGSLAGFEQLEVNSITAAE